MDNTIKGLFGKQPEFLNKDKNCCIKGLIFKAINNGSDLYLIKCDGYSVNWHNIKNNNNHMSATKSMSARRTALVWHQRFGHGKKSP